MMTFVEATANAPIYKTGKPFSKERFTIFLLVDDIYTSIHTHSRTLAGAHVAARALSRDAERYIEEAGMMPWLFAKITAKASGRPELPFVTDTVWLTKDVAGLPKGAPLLVVESGWRLEDEGCLPENTFPIMAVPLTDGEPDPALSPFPLALDEYTTIPPAEAVAE